MLTTSDIALAAGVFVLLVLNRPAVGYARVLRVRRRAQRRRGFVL